MCMLYLVMIIIMDIHMYWIEGVVFDVSVLWQGDNRGQYLPVTASGNPCSLGNLNGSKCTGGLWHLAYRVEHMRESTPNLILLQTGNFIQGTLFSKAFKGEEAFEFFEDIGFDVISLGPRDWDNLAGLPMEDTLALWITNRSYTVTVSSYDLSGVPSLVDKIPRVFIKKMNETEVGFVGISVLDATTSNGYPPGFKELDSMSAVRYGVSRLINLGVKIIILIVNGDTYLRNSLSFAQNIPGIDVIINGRVKTDSPFTNNSNNLTALSPAGNQVPIVCVKDNAIHMGRLDLTFDEHGLLISSHSQLIPLTNPNTTTPFTESIKAKVLQKYTEAVSLVKTEIIAYSDRLLPGSNSSLTRTQEIALGSLITDALRLGTNTRVHFAVINSGAIRADLPWGNLSIADVYTALPFPNRFVVANVTGSDVVYALLNSVAVANSLDIDNADTSGRFLQVSGIKFSWNPEVNEPLVALPGTSISVPNRICSVSIMDEEGIYQAIDLERVYTVAMNDYLASGGDYYKVFLNASILFDAGQSLQNSFIDYLKTLQVISISEEGRITRVSTIPPDWQNIQKVSPVWITWESLPSVLGIVFASIEIVLFLLTILFVIYWRGHGDIRASSIEYSTVILVGMMMSAISVLFWIGPPTIFTCNARAVTFFIGFQLSYGALLTKNWRIRKIYDCDKELSLTKLQSLRITNTYLARFLAFIVGIGIFIVSLGISLDPMEPIVYYSNYDVPRWFCTYSYHLYASFAYMGILIVVGLILGFKLRKMPKSYNETRAITHCTFVFVVSGSFAAFLSAFLWTVPLLIYSICIGLLLTSVFLAWVILFVPKILAVWKDPNKTYGEWQSRDDSNLNVIRRTRGSSNQEPKLKIKSGAETE
eukprot:TRINITY_DN20142_c0_g1_i1.p1 TRINITY_DN20142_c0_g1~~TRINITY_DN20142_c0_g1_i1.p1  ORF type:complete len:875 (+),score=137.88 TRINITY_DN20142_c0_g1_i1:25-2649(+)